MEDERGQVAHVRWIWWAQTRLWLNSHCHAPSTRGSLLPPLRLRLSALPPRLPSPPPSLPQPRLIYKIMGVAVCQSCGGGKGVGSMSLSGGARQASAVGRGAEGRSSKVACVWTRQHLREKRNANRRGARRGSERNTAQIAADCKLDSSAWWLGCSP